MNIDFTVPLENREASALRMRGTPLQKILYPRLNNRGRFNNQIKAVIPTSDRFVFVGNCPAALYYTQSFGTPGLMFQATMRSSKSFCMTQWQFGPLNWIWGT